MTIIVAGTLDFDPGDAERAIVDGGRYIAMSLEEPGCTHYAWTLDPLKPGRVWVYEEWTSEAALADHFLAEGYLKMRDHLGASGLRASSVLKYRVDLAEPVYDAGGTPRANFFTADAAA